jgi:hypothetical protein
MARACESCRHPERDELNRALVTGRSYREVAARYGLSLAGVARHRANHLPEALLQAERRRNSDGIADEVRGLVDRVLAILDRAEESGDDKIALRAIAEARPTLELLGRLSGDIAGAEARAVGEAQREAKALEMVEAARIWESYVASQLGPPVTVTGILEAAPETIEGNGQAERS